MILMLIVCMIVLPLDGGFNNHHKHCHDLSLKNDNKNNDSCNDINDYELKWFDKYFHLGRFPPGVHLPLENVSVLANLSLLNLPPSEPPATSKACLKYRRKRIGQLEDIFTCSPLETKVVQPWLHLGVARSGRESRYLPTESYLGQREDDDGDNDDLNTCPPSHENHCYQHNPQLWRNRSDTEQRISQFRCFEESAPSHL